MSVPTKSIRGISALIHAARLICKLNGTFRPVYITVLTGPELAALDVLTAACQEFDNMFPLGG